MLRQPQRDETPTSLFNPLMTDFTVQMADNDNQPQSYTLHAQEIETFPAYIANHIKKHLAQFIYQERDLGKFTQESVMPDILKEIEVDYGHPKPTG